MTSLKIGCVGEAMIELSVDEQGRQAAVGYAGDTLNTAIYLKRNIGPECQVNFISVIGKDRFSDVMFDYIESEKINCDLLFRHPSKLPGIYAISKDKDGDRTFSYWRDSSAARTLFSTSTAEADYSPLGGLNVIYLSAITLAILPTPIVDGLFKWLASFRQSGGRVVFDSNYRPKLWPSKKVAQDVVGRAWLLTDIGLPSLDDEMDLFDDVDEAAALARLKSYDIPILVVKRGDKGPIGVIDGAVQQQDYPFSKADKVVDTTSAGDSFNGAFLASFLMGSSLIEAMREGHDMAIKVIAYQGAIIDKDLM